MSHLSNICIPVWKNQTFSVSLRLYTCGGMAYTQIICLFNNTHIHPPFFYNGKIKQWLKIVCSVFTSTLFSKETYSTANLEAVGWWVNVCACSCSSCFQVNFLKFVEPFEFSVNSCTYMAFAPFSHCIMHLCFAFPSSVSTSSLPKRIPGLFDSMTNTNSSLLSLLLLSLQPHWTCALFPHLKTLPPGVPSCLISGWNLDFFL